MPARSAPRRTVPFGCQITMPAEIAGALKPLPAGHQYRVGDSVHLGLEADHGHVVTVVPHPQAVVLEHGGAGREPRPTADREALALVDGQGGARPHCALRRAVAAFRRVRRCGYRAPTPAAGSAHALPAAMSSTIHAATCRQPADCQVSNGPAPSRNPSGWPGRRRARYWRYRPGGRRCNGTVAEAGPEELRLRMLAGAAGRTSPPSPA